MSLSILQKPDQLGSPPARLVIACRGGVTLGPPMAVERPSTPWADYNYKSTVGGLVLIWALAVAAVTC